MTSVIKRQLLVVTCVGSFTQVTQHNAQEGPDSTVNVVLEVNRLRRQLAVSALTWVAAVHDPAVYARSTSPAAVHSHPVAPDDTHTPREGNASVWAWLAKVNDPSGDGTDATAAEAALVPQSGVAAAGDVAPVVDGNQEAILDNSNVTASAHGRRVSLVGIVSPRQGQGLVAQSKALSGPVVGSRGGHFGSAGSGADSRATSQGVAIKAPSVPDGGSEMPIGSHNYDGHFADWARFIDGTLTSPGEQGALADAAQLEDVAEGEMVQEGEVDKRDGGGVVGQAEGSKGSAAAAAAVTEANGLAEAVRVKALQAQQVCDVCG